MDTTDAKSAATEEHAAGFAWRVHPAREQLGRTLAALAVIAALAGLAGELMHSPWWALIAAAVPVIFLNRFFFPSRFSIDAGGITAVYPLRRRSLRWQDLRRFDHDARGGVLSTRSRRTRVNAHRELFLLFDRRGREIADRIRAYLPEGVVVWHH